MRLMFIIRLNDYIIIEGYLSIKKNLQSIKQVEITVLKIYPLFLNDYPLRDSIEN